MNYSFTGHRPPKLGGYSANAQNKITEFAVFALPLIAERNGPIEYCISGMALGWDMAIARACVELSIPFIAAIPFPQQADRWPNKAQIEWNALVSAAVRVETISQSYSDDAMQERNKWMVDNSDMLIALWDGSEGGTSNCISYARAIRHPIRNAWRKWENFNPAQFNSPTNPNIA